jgi:hypothetical protein
LLFEKVETPSYLEERLSSEAARLTELKRQFKLSGVTKNIVLQQEKTAVDFYV